MHKLFFLIFVTFFGLNSWAHESQGFKFTPEVTPSSSNLPRCTVVQNKELIDTVLDELRTEGKENVRYEGEGQFCFDEMTTVDGSKYQSPNCFLDPDHDKMWILMIGEVRTGKTFQTQEEGFVEAAYRHAEGTCIFPFTFYLDSE